MAYFKHLPDILYQSPLSHKNSSGDYINIKNISLDIRKSVTIKSILL